MKTIFAAVAAMAFVPLQAIAAEVTLAGSGDISSSGFGGNLSTGQSILVANPYGEPSDAPFSFEVVLDTSAPNQQSGGTSGLFDAVSSFKVSNSLCTVDLGGGSVQVTSLSSDQVVITGRQSGGSVACDDVPVDFDRVELAFGFDKGTLSTKELAPLDWPLGAANFASLTFIFDQTETAGGITISTNGFASGDVTDVSIVPLPGAIALFLPTLMAAGVIRRRVR